jgi:hypothetical protein
MSLLDAINPAKYYLQIGIIVVVLGFVAGLYTWHKFQIHSAVKQAQSVMQKDIALGSLRLKDREYEASKALQTNVAKIVKDKDEKLKEADTRYRALNAYVAGVFAKSGGTNQGILPGTTSNSENIGKGVEFKLSRKNADDLAGYASDSEKVRLSLVACYNQYDEVVKNLKEYAAKNK